MNQPEEAEPDVTKLADQLRDADLDYKFAQFLRIQVVFLIIVPTKSEALQTLNQIIKIEQINNVFCWDQDLKNFLTSSKRIYTRINRANDAAFITCEYLIAFDGRIMLSHNNILHYHSSRLPSKIIIMANVSQIASNLNEAMMKVKRAGNLKTLHLSAVASPNWILLIRIIPNFSYFC
jgi:L-lactate utilization protein LutC